MHTLTNQVRERIRAEYCGPGTAGRKLPTERELVTAMGASRSTIQVAMADLASQGVVQRHRRRGTFVVGCGEANSSTAEGAQRSALTNVGLVWRSLRSPSAVEQLSAIHHELYGCGVLAIAAESRNEVMREVELVRQMVERQVAGLLVKPVLASVDASTFARQVQTLSLGQRLPMVLLEPTAQYPGASVVARDHDQAGYTAARHLIDLGHRRLGYVCLRNTQAYDRQAAGFGRAMHEAGLVMDPEHVLEIDSMPYTADTLTKGRLAARLLLSLSQRPTAVFVYWAEVAAGMMMECVDRGVRVPDDLAVLAAGELKPDTSVSLPLPLSRVAFDDVAIAQAAVRRLLHQIDHGISTEATLFPSELRAVASTLGRTSAVNDSSAPAAASAATSEGESHASFIRRV